MVHSSVQPKPQVSLHAVLSLKLTPDLRVLSSPTGPSRLSIQVSLHAVLSLKLTPDLRTELESPELPSNETEPLKFRPVREL